MNRTMIAINNNCGQEVMCSKNTWELPDGNKNSSENGNLILMN